MAQARLPNEILDDIAGEIEQPSNLLALALTCRQFRDTILVRHIRYRNVSCLVTDHGKLENMLQHPDRARNIRTFDILQLTDFDWHVGFMAGFVDAVRVMERLVDLRIAFSCQSGSYDLDSWRALWQCVIDRRRLRRLEIKVIPAEIFAGIDRLDFLHDFKVTVFHFGHGDFNKLATFISQNVKLKTLDITCIPPNNATIWDLIDSSLFPDLKSLILESQSHHGLLDHGPSPLMLFDFIRRHQNLETFQTRKIHLPIVQADPGSLPFLAVLYNNVSSDAVIAMLSNHTNHPRPLKEIGGVTCGHRFFESLKYVNCQTVHTLRDVRFISTDDLAALPGTFPYLEVLTLKSAQMRDGVNGKGELSYSEWIEYLRPFEYLRTFRGACLFSDYCRDHLISGELEEITHELPRIERIDMIRSARELVIDRNDLSWSVGL